jgi:hypothetical protein
MLRLRSEREDIDMIVQLGQTPHFTVSYDDTLAANANHPSGQTLAQSVLDYCEYDYARLASLFGVTLKAQNLPIAVTIQAGNGSAFNDGVSAIAGGFPPAITSTVTANTGYLEPGLIEPNVVAELAEIFMAAQGAGWNPGWSDGEALSRVSGQILYPENAWLFQTGADWFNATTHTNPVDWVDNVEHTDQDFASIGCGSLFLNYLAYQLNFTWPAIYQAGAPSTAALAETAGILGASGGYAAFLSLLQTSFPTGNLFAGKPADEWLDDVYPLGSKPAQLPALYMRNNTSNDATNHGGPLSDSPDIILKNAQVANPQATYSTPQSIANANESDANVVAGQTNYLYLRVWNGGLVAAKNVFATVYYSPPATLVTPSMWTLIGTSYYATAPTGSQVEVTSIGIPWPADQIPAPGHYCFVATVGCNYQPAPVPELLANFATFQDYENYIADNPNVTWRNFNVVQVQMGQIRPPWGHLVPLPFHLTGAWMEDVVFQFETIAALPEGSALAFQAAEWVGRGLRPARQDLTFHLDRTTDPANTRRVRMPLSISGTHVLGEIKLPTRTVAPSHLLAYIPLERHNRPCDVVIRQLHRGREVGRITWRLGVAAD